MWATPLFLMVVMGWGIRIENVKNKCYIYLGHELKLTCWQEKQQTEYGMPFQWNGNWGII